MTQNRSPGRAVVVLSMADLAPLVTDAQWIAAAFTPEELADLGHRRDRPESLAARVAAKRAVLRATQGDGADRASAREPDALRRVEVLLGPDGAPLVRLAGTSDGSILVSISHDGGLAGAVALALDRGPESG